MPKSREFYLACLRDNVGSNTAFHRKNGAGYTTNIEEAEVYLRADMQALVTRGHVRQDIDLPLSKPAVDALLRTRVDMQNIAIYDEAYPKVKSQSGLYYAVVKRDWDGNDLVFMQHSEDSPELNTAVHLKEHDPIQDKYYKVRVEAFVGITRSTFPWSKINRRTMIQGAGITGVHTKPKKKAD